MRVGLGLSYRLALGSLSDPLSYLQALTGTASALTYGQFAAMECAIIKPLGLQSNPAQGSCP